MKEPSFDTVNLLTGAIFQITWDLGRRCNYDCSYCPPHRHDNFSRHATFDELKSSVDFVLKYADLYNTYRNYKEVGFTFTGGEPTVNPYFIDFFKYLRAKYNENYKDKYTCFFSVTSNGAVNKNMVSSITKYVDHITVSYHTEATKQTKERVKENILKFKDKISVSVNVMFHAEYFDECIEVCDYLKKNEVTFVPRIIGEEKVSNPSYAHKYTFEQLSWMKEFWGIKGPAPDDEKEKKQRGSDIGRPCCGSRNMCLSKGDVSREDNFVDYREFKGWHCSVNWFFMHIEQQTDNVFHHQTCQATFEQSRGPICRLSKGHKFLKILEGKLKNNTLPYVVCSKDVCGCGLCAPKSLYKDKFKEIFSKYSNYVEA